MKVHVAKKNGRVVGISIPAPNTKGSTVLVGTDEATVEEVEVDVNPNDKEGYHRVLRDLGAAF